jgi:hypothetical protein
MTTVKDFIFTGDKAQFWREVKHEPNPSRCAYEVAETGRMTHWYQCNHKPVETIEGYGFCKTHAGIVKRKLGIKRDTTIRYAASFEYGKPFLAELEVVKETDHTIEISKVTNVLGDAHLFTGSSRKDGRWMNVYEFFDTAKEAHRWLLKEAEEHVADCKKSFKSAEEVYNKLLRGGL